MGVALWSLGVDFGPFRVNCGHLGVDYWLSGDRFGPLRANFGPLEVDFLPLLRAGGRAYFENGVFFR